MVGREEREGQEANQLDAVAVPQNVPMMRLWGLSESMGEFLVNGRGLGTTGETGDEDFVPHVVRVYAYRAKIQTLLYGDASSRRDGP